MQVAWWTTFEEKHRAEVAAESSIFGGENGKKRQEDLRLRVIEHNILVIAKYYSRITVARLAQLLDLPAAEVRRHPWIASPSSDQRCVCETRIAIVEAGPATSQETLLPASIHTYVLWGSARSHCVCAYS